MTGTGRRSVRAQAPGKINVSFRVGPARPDGYHSVASVYLAVSLFEEVTATRTDSDSITVSVRSGQMPGFDASQVPLDGGNLAVKAARLLADVTPGAGGVHLDILKSVPVAGGMGGGSADAAAALVACDALWGAGFSRDELARIAAGLGADVPFALLGGAAVGLGIGDRLTAALAPATLHWVLVPAAHGLSTPAVYATLDRLRAESGQPCAEPMAVDPAILAAIRAGDTGSLSDALHNDLQAAALVHAPDLAAVLAAGEECGALAGLVSGSGPTVAFLTTNEDRALEVRDDLTAAGLDAVAVTGPVRGARILAEI